jgi:methylmalonyl-CoA mutase C-terminal domain/subunit
MVSIEKGPFIFRGSDMERKKRIVIAKPGLDGHDRGAKVVARSLADAGFEVIYTGRFQTPAQIVATAIQENADGIGISILSGAHLTLFKKIIDLLREKKADDIVLFGGGVIMDDDIPKLKDMGVAEIFTPGASTSEIVEFIKNIGSDSH